jgi:hypothetical protein
MMEGNGLVGSVDFDELICALRKTGIACKRQLGLADDQTFIKQFIRHYPETENHKKMKSIAISELLKSNIPENKILVGKRPIKTEAYCFRPDITIKDKGSFTFIECHYHDGWSHGSYGHLYNNVEKVRKWARIIICVTADYDARKSVEKRVMKQKVLSKAHEIWVLDIENGIVKRKVLVNN